MWNPVGLIVRNNLSLRGIDYQSYKLFACTLIFPNFVSQNWYMGVMSFVGHLFPPENDLEVRHMRANCFPQGRQQHRRLPNNLPFSPFKPSFRHDIRP